MIVLLLLYGLGVLENLRTPILGMIETISDHPLLSGVLFTLMTWFALVLGNMFFLAFMMFPWYIVLIGILCFLGTTWIVAYLFDKYLKRSLT